MPEPVAFPPSPDSPADPARAGAEYREPDALLSRLRLIEDQPLETRTAAFGQLHDELRAILEDGDTPQHHA